MKTILLSLTFLAAFSAYADDRPKAEEVAIEKSNEVPTFTKEKIEGWGIAFDLSADCKFAAKNGEMVITVPGGKPHDLSTELASATAPRVLRPVGKDFTIQVKVDGDFNPGEESTQPARTGYTGAGLVVFADEKNYVRIERATLQHTGDEPRPYTNFEIRVDGELERIGTTGDAPIEAGKPTWLRLQRKGNQLMGAVSQDGKTWKELPPKDLGAAWQKQTLAGIAAISTSKIDFTPKYSELTVTEKPESK